MYADSDSIAGIAANLPGDPSTECALRILRWKNAVTVNQHSLVTRFTHNGVTTMQLGDADERVIKELLDSEAPLRSHVLVWPHHQWCPADPNIQNLLMRFLRVVRPQVIVITQPKSGVQNQSKPRLSALLQQYQQENHGVIIHWLENGEVRLVTWLEPDRQGTVSTINQG